MIKKQLHDFSLFSFLATLGMTGCWLSMLSTGFLAALEMWPSAWHFERSERGAMFAGVLKAKAPSKWLKNGANSTLTKNLEQNEYTS